MTAQQQPTSAPAPVWQLRLLGGFELNDGVQRHAKLASRPTMALLARLALQPGSNHPRETLADLLWPDTEGDASRQRLRQALSTLKQVLEPADQRHTPVLDADRHSVRLVPGRVHCDALDFEAAFKTGDHDRAHTLYAGELLPGFFEEWIGDERLRLEGRFDRLRPPQVPAAAPAAPVASAPAAAAVTARPASTPTRTQLPAYLTRLVAADPQVARLAAAVADHRLVTLMGPGGSGKTRLSVAVAQTLADRAAFELVMFVPLATCRTRQQLLDQLLLTLRVGVGKGGALDTLTQALQGQHVLLVLDNFEQVVDEGAEVVAELGAALPQMHQLISSRRALALTGECELTVAALGLPSTEDTLTAAASNPSVTLFVDRVRAARAEFSLHEGNRAAVIELVQLLDGMPLAIELAAAFVRSMAPAEMAATLRAARQHGSPGEASALALLARAPVRGRQGTRRHSMRETIARSWDLLSPALRDPLAQLTVFQGGFSAAAAQAVCVSSPAAARQVPLQLDEPLSHSLLPSAAAEHDADSLRFSVYEPIREFALDQLAAEAAAPLRRRHRAGLRRRSDQRSGDGVDPHTRAVCVGCRRDRRVLRQCGHHAKAKARAHAAIALRFRQQFVAASLRWRAG